MCCVMPCAESCCSKRQSQAPADLFQEQHEGLLHGLTSMLHLQTDNKMLMKKQWQELAVAGAQAAYDAFKMREASRELDHVSHVLLVLSLHSSMPDQGEDSCRKLVAQLVLSAQLSRARHTHILSSCDQKMDPTAPCTSDL